MKGDYGTYLYELYIGAPESKTFCPGGFPKYERSASATVLWIRGKEERYRVPATCQSMLVIIEGSGRSPRHIPYHLLRLGLNRCYVFRIEPAICR